VGVTFETGQSVRWRGGRWRVIEEEINGFLRLVGVDTANRDRVVTPLVALEGDDLQPEQLPLPPLDVAVTDRARWRALHQAHLVSMAGGREQLVGLDWGAVTVEPYQLVPLLRVARSIRPRLLIGDATGLGKTAEAGVVLRWLAQRHQANRILIVTRAAPDPDRWYSEMWHKFGFRFDILESGADFAARRKASPTINVFAQQPRMIVSMTLAARQVFLDELRQCPLPYDVVVVDEAHHLAERGSSTKRLAVLGRTLARSCKDGALLLLTAVPHDGKTDSFLSILRLLDPLVETNPGEVPVDAASRLIVRRLKPEVTLAGGKRLVDPEVHVFSTLRDATRAERALDEPLDRYLGWLAAEEARYQGRGARQKAQGCQFLATLLRKRFGSSVAALRATLRRRLDLPPAPEDSDDAVPLCETDAPDPEDEVIDPGAAAGPPPPPLAPAEADVARELLTAAEGVTSGNDAKLRALSRLLTGPLAGEKVVVFTEYRDTLRAAARRLTRDGVSFVSFHGETSDAERREAIRSFNHDPAVRIFLATDAASEGQNLQRSACHLVCLDVPWNPNRYIQRAGRIARYGQERTPHVWALVAADRRARAGRPEHRALEVIVEKLNIIQRELGSTGTVLPVSGTVQALLAQAHTTADDEVDRLLETARTEREVEDDLSRLTYRNQREIAEAEAYVARLGTTDDFEPTVGTLLRTAFRAWDDGGEVAEAGGEQVSVRVPARLRLALGFDHIPLATFRRDIAVAAQDDDPDTTTPEFLTPAHPLVEQVLRRLRDDAVDPTFRHRFDVEVGTPGLVCSFAVRFVDGDGRTVEERLEAVEVDASGTVSTDADSNLKRLGLDAPGAGGRPNPEAVAGWQADWPDHAATATAEAQRRAEARRLQLVAIAEDLREQELAVLTLWRSEQARQVERLIFGADVRMTFEQSAEFDARMAALDAEHQTRRDALRDRSAIRVAGVELIGGRLYVEPDR
jgi:superfamily II DNA or RNA helicase